MFATARRGGVIALSLATLALLSSPPLSARMTVGGSPDLARLVEESDVVCVGEVVGRESIFVNRRIETTYRVRADQYLLGSGDEELELTLMGGEVEEPFPMAMIFEGMVTMSEGQDVVLFLQRPRQALQVPGVQSAAAQGSLSAAMTSLRVTHGELGVLTVLDDVKSGERYVGRIGRPNPSVVMTDETNRVFLNAARESVSALIAGHDPDLQLKSDLLEIGSQIAEEGQARRQVRTSSGGLIPLDLLVPKEAEDSEPTAARAAGAGTGAGGISGLRTLDDLCSEIRDLAERGGR